MRRLSIALVLGLVVAGLFVTGAGATAPGGWNHLGNGGTAGTPSLNGPVAALNTDAPGLLIVGGGFTDAGGIANADRLATWNGTTWNSIGSTPLDNGEVRAIAYHAGNVYLGGTFGNARGIGTLDLLAMWNGLTWGPACGGTIGGSVLALQVVGNSLYVGGAFQNGAGIAEADYLLKCDLTTAAASAVPDERPTSWPPTWS